MATPTRPEWEPHRSTRHSTRNPRHLDDDAKRAKSKIGLAINRMKKRLAELHFSAVRNVTRRSLSGGALFKLHSKVAHEARVTSLGVLTASIAHEVDQPLAAIVISGQFSLRLLAQTEPDIDKVREVTGRMISDARRASEIIDRMLAMTTRRTPEREPLSLNEVIQESIVFFRHELQSKGISIAFELAPALPQVVGDRTQLQQVIVNLTINAIRAMAQSEAPRPTILIRTLRPNAQTVCCVVEDSGPGIDSAHLPHLFYRFYTTKDAGMGLGLAISRSVIEAHGGCIRADNNSELGGARFTFALPAAHEEGLASTWFVR